MLKAGGNLDQCLNFSENKVDIIHCSLLFVLYLSVYLVSNCVSRWSQTKCDLSYFPGVLGCLVFCLLCQSIGRRLSEEHHHSDREKV